MTLKAGTDPVVAKARDRMRDARLKELERRVRAHDAEIQQFERRLAERARMLAHAEVRARKAEAEYERLVGVMNQRPLVEEECWIRWCRNVAGAEGQEGMCDRCWENVQSWRKEPDHAEEA